MENFPSSEAEDSNLDFVPREPNVVEKLKLLGIDPDPANNEFIRYYPPLKELPIVDEPCKINLSEVKGSLALFMYIPFCTGRCSFCFYPKRVPPTEDAIDSYIDLLRKEIGIFSPTIPSEISSIYVGGGTPSVMSALQMDRLFGDLGIPISPTTTMTCEVSPETLTLEKIEALKRNGATRISMGIQSLDDRVLTEARRRYNSAEATEKIRLLKDNIDSFNLDFIYGLKSQNIQDILNILRFIEEIQPPSVTFYQKWSAMKDRATSLGSTSSTQALEELMEMRNLISVTMSANGYMPDSLFRFVKSDKDGCGYCKTVWEDNSCIATGISAYSYINGQAAQNTYNFRHYQKMVEGGNSPVRRAKKLSSAEQATRALVLGLKTAGANCKLDIGAIERRYDVSCEQEVLSLVNELEEIGLVVMQDKALNFTDAGIVFAEQILGKLMEKMKKLQNIVCSPTSKYR